jgi:F-type H+-transporting ATPase subunit delta
MSVAENRYAKAFLDALYPDQAEVGLQQLRSFAKLLGDQPDIRRLFENPTFSADRRKNLLEEFAEALALNRRTVNFLNLLIDRNRLGLLERIVEAYQKLFDDRLGIVRADVTSAHPLDTAQRRQLSTALENVTGKQVRMEVTVDRTLIGGFVARVGGTIYDGSVRQRLQAFKYRLIQDK